MRSRWLAAVALVAAAGAVALRWDAGRGPAGAEPGGLDDREPRPPAPSAGRDETALAGVPGGRRAVERPPPPSPADRPWGALRAERAVFGTVVDDAGRPIEGARVIVSVERGAQRATLGDLPPTDANGRFAAHVGFAARSAAITVIAAGRARVEARVPVGTWASIEVPAQAILRGRVTDARSRASVEGAWLTLRGRGRPGGLHADATTGADGTFEIPVGVGPAELQVYGGFVESTRTAVVVAAPETSVDVVVGTVPPMGILGRMVGDRPEGRAASIRLGGAPRDAPWATVDADGRFELAGSRRDASPRLELELSGVGRLDVSGTVVGVDEDGARLRVEVPWPRPTRIEGRVLADRVPVEGARLVHDCGEHAPTEATTARDGTFLLETWCPGRATPLEVIAPDGLRTTVPPGAEAEIELPPAARVHGRVVDLEERPVPGARIVVGHVESFANDDGAYAMTVGSGERRIFVTAPGFARARARLRLAAGEDLARDLHLRPGGALAGRVVEAGGGAVGDAIVRVYDAAGSRLEESVRTMPDGRWSAEDVAGPPFRLVVVAEGFEAVAREGIEADVVVPDVVLRRR